MEGLIIGIDLSDDYCRINGMRQTDPEPADISIAQADGRPVIQTALGRRRGDSEWKIGKEAYEAALTGEGFVVDKLLTRLLNGESLEAGEETYPAQTLMAAFLERLLTCVFRYYEQEENGTIPEKAEDNAIKDAADVKDAPEDGTAGAGTAAEEKLPDTDAMPAGEEAGFSQFLKGISTLIFSIRHVDRDVTAAILSCTDLIGVDRDSVRVISRTEAFLYYVLSQKKELWTNESVLFDWSCSQVHFYRLNVVRGTHPNTVYVEHKVLEENLPAELEDENNRRNLDAAVSPQAKALLDKSHISSVFLSGKGLENCSSWPQGGFITAVGTRRRVFCEMNLFSRGAVVAGADGLREETAFPYTIICEGRIAATVMMDVLSRGAKKSLILAKRGSLWYEVQNRADLILDDCNAVNIRIEQSEGKLVRVFSIPLEHFPERPNKTTKIQVVLTFASENEAVIRVVDMGFGELFPSSGMVKKSRIRITE